MLLKIAVLLCSLCAIGSASFGSRCPICTQEHIDACPEVIPSENCQVIQEPNCGCCQMCARKLDESCGVAVGDCEEGLTCAVPLSAVKCLTAVKFMDLLVEGKLTCITMKTFHRVLETVDSNDLDQGSSKRKLKCKDRGKNRKNRKRNQKRKSVEVIDKHPLYPNTVETCFKHFDEVDAKPRYDKHEWVPSCEDDGFYYPLQCEVAHGRKRGRCWCVDRFGEKSSDYLNTRSRQRKCEKGTLRGT